ncbi:hypothetical protein [uncultured Demequina sp.]|uniref:hypothetical protein n=1 Tax=uncultured Demequina sp. TaxID=693499 RepID=UPI0025E4F33A|nr:hypothetical protein [uncultured Demequina sp.]
MTDRPRRATLGRAVAAAGAVALAAVGVSGCSWRAETPPPDWPSPDTTTVTRDAAAEREQAVIDAVSPFTAAATAQAHVLAELEAVAAPVRLDALGGVYVAYPDASPSPSPSGDWTAQDMPNPTEAVASARDGHLADGLTTEDPDLAALLRSAGLSQALSDWFAVWVEDRISSAELAVVEERSLSSASLPHASPVPESTAMPTATVAELALAHDQARYAYEVMAASASGDERDTWLQRRDLQAARASALAAQPGVEDPRSATYTLLLDDYRDHDARLSTAVALENGLGATYAGLALGARPDEVPWLLNAAFDAYAQAAAFGEPSAAAWTVPALPGIDS